jgi:hypothetical protein
MSEQIQDPNTETESNPTEELAVLKERAKMLGISHGNNIGLESLRKKVNDKLNGVSETETEDPTSVGPIREKTKAEKEQELRTHLIKESMALVRCKIYNLNPDKRDLKGEIITVANKYIGKVQKFIPFGEETDNGYHIPKVLYDDLIQRQYQDIRSKEKNGKVEIIRRMAPEYNIVVLDPLTPEELAELALKQAAAERVGV